MTPDATATAGDLKVCNGCGRSKPRSAFPRDGKTFDGRRGRCRLCEKKTRRRAAQRNRRKGSGEWLAVAGCPSARQLYRVGLGSKPYRRERLDIPACPLCGAEHMLLEIMPRERLPSDPPVDVDLAGAIEAGDVVAEGVAADV